MSKFGRYFSPLPLFPVLMSVSHRFVVSLILLLINHFYSQQQDILAPMPSWEMIHYFHSHINIFIYLFIYFPLEPNDLLPSLLPVISEQHPSSDLHLFVMVRFRPCSPNRSRLLKFTFGSKYCVALCCSYLGVFQLCNLSFLLLYSCHSYLWFFI